ncbi:mucin-1 isoform X2 [Molossus molossus]|uniref:mucin-1 isoform X2 n=1 Tax=Molossus molossus TaxID=27622 RepID=UPI00174768B1|nr:mucin-1 isoform X2 [Molossus molossus]
MTPGIQAPFLLLLLLFSVITGEEHKATTTPAGKETPSSVPSHHSDSPFNSSLEDPSTNYYQELQRNITGLAVCQCRRKNCGQLDIFPTRDAYHPMSEYPTYHTHGRYVPPGSSKRSPYEEVSAGNGGSSLSYTNTAATSANL